MRESSTPIAVVTLATFVIIIAILSSYQVRFCEGVAFRAARAIGAAPGGHDPLAVALANEGVGLVEGDPQGDAVGKTAKHHGSVLHKGIHLR